MTVADRLRAIVDILPDGSAVTLPVEVVRAWLDCDGGRQTDVLRPPPGSDLTLEQVAERLGRAVSTVRGWCNSRALAGAYKLNTRDWRIPERALEEYLGRQRGPEGGRQPTSGSASADDITGWRRLK